MRNLWRKTSNNFFRRSGRCSEYMFILKIIQCYGTILGVYVDLFCTKWFSMNVITRLIKNHTVEHFICNINSYNFVSYKLFSILSFYFARNNKPALQWFIEQCEFTNVKICEIKMRCWQTSIRTSRLAGSLDFWPFFSQRNCQNTDFNNQKYIVLGTPLKSQTRYQKMAKIDFE